jgi:hypothetical protein
MSRADDEPITITITRGALIATINCVRAGADDRLEPERYREWYEDAHSQLIEAARRAGLNLADEPR